MSFCLHKLNKKDAQKLSIDMMAHLMSKHYLEHAGWPSANETVELAAVCNFAGDINAAIDRALDMVQMSIRTWEEYHVPSKRRNWVKLLGETFVAKDEARRDSFIERMERKNTTQRKGDVFGRLMARLLKWGHNDEA